MKRFLVLLSILTIGTMVWAQSVEIGFARKGMDPSAKNLVLKVINSAKSEIRMAAYNFTDPDIIGALGNAKRRGVDVQIVHDYVASSEKGDGTQAMKSVGIQIRLDRNYKIAHNKFIIVDRQTVETGSFNYSTNANKENAENVIVLWNYPKEAAIYLTEWALYWVESQ